jgi:hypothetical protein
MLSRVCTEKSDQANLLIAGQLVSQTKFTNAHDGLEVFFINILAIDTRCHMPLPLAVRAYVNRRFLFRAFECYQ